MKQAEGPVVVSAVLARSPRKVIFVLAVASEAHEPSFASAVLSELKHHLGRAVTLLLCSSSKKRLNEEC